MFVTTNYDPFHERALAHRAPLVVVRDRHLNRVGSNSTVIYKVHGDADEPTGCVITKHDFTAWESSTGNLPVVMAQIMLQRCVVAIGYSARDPHFERILFGIGAALPASDPEPRPLYVVMPKPLEEAFARFEPPLYNVVLIDARGEDFIEWLIAAMDASRRARAAQAIRSTILQSSVRTARQQAMEAARETDLNDAAGKERRRGEAATRLADALRVANRWSESLVERARAVRHFRDAGDVGRATSLFMEVANEAVRLRRAAILFESLRRLMAPFSTGVGMHPEPPDDGIATTIALGESLMGDPDEDLPAYLKSLRKRANEATAGERASIEARLAYLEGEHFVSRLEFAAASEAYERSANFDAQPDIEDLAALRIRAALFRALSGQAQPALSTLRAMSVQASPVEEMRQRALGWAEVIAGDVDAAIRSFQTAAHSAADRADANAAMLALQCAEWARRLRLTFEWIDDPPALVARGLTPLIDERDSWITVESLLEDSDRALVEGEARTAVRHALAARRLAYNDVDPYGVAQAEIRVARALVDLAAEDNRDEVRREAIVSLGLARAGFRDRHATDIVQTAAGLYDLAAHRPTLIDALRRLERLAVDNYQYTGLLRLLLDLSQLLSSKETQEVAVAAILAGLDRGYGGGVTNPGGAALGLVRAIGERLSPDCANAVVRALVAISERADWYPREEVFAALGSAAHASRLPPDEAESLIINLQGAVSKTSENPSRRAGSSPAIALAIVATRNGSPLQSSAAATLGQEARRGRWVGIAAFAAGGAPIDPELLNLYLEETTRVMRALTVASDPGSYGYGFSVHDQPILSSQAGQLASPKLVAEAISVGLALISFSGQWARTRAAWLPHVARLLKHRPESISGALPTITGLARGQIERPGDLEDASRKTSGKISLQKVAIESLGYILPAAPQELISTIQDSIEAAWTADAMEVRFAAVHAADTIAQEIPRDTSTELKHLRAWAIRQLTLGALDLDEQVREAAVHDLRSAGVGNEVAT
jgi:hypothetical protein